MSGFALLIGRPLRRGLAGCVERIVDGRITGRVRDPARPFVRLPVAATLSDGRVLHGLADRYRADVQLAGFGDGHHGFALRLPAAAAVVAVSVAGRRLALP